MKLVLVTPYDVKSGSLRPQEARSDIGVAFASEFTTERAPMRPPQKIHATQCIVSMHTDAVADGSIFVKESVAELIAAS
jgi:hypothetical protein